MKINYDCRVAHARCVIWYVEIDGDAHFLHLTLGQVKVWLKSQSKKNKKYSYLVRFIQDSKNVIYFPAHVDIFSRL